MFIWVLSLCLFCAIAFAGLATLLSTTRGNTITETMNARHLSDEDAIKIVLGKLSIATTLPIVALYIIALAMGVGLPAFLWWENTRNPAFITVVGDFDKRPAKAILIENGDPYSGSFSWDIPYEDGSKQVTFFSDAYKPVTLNFKLDKQNATLQVDVTNFGSSAETETLPVSISTRIVTLKNPLPLDAASPPPPISSIPSTPSSPPQEISPELSKFGPPPGERM